LGCLHWRKKLETSSRRGVWVMSDCNILGIGVVGAWWIVLGSSSSSPLFWFPSLFLPIPTRAVAFRALRSGQNIIFICNWKLENSRLTRMDSDESARRTANVPNTIDTMRRQRFEVIHHLARAQPHAIVFTTSILLLHHLKSKPSRFLVMICSCVSSGYLLRYRSRRRS